jgi:hypothetical protein
MKFRKKPIVIEAVQFNDSTERLMQLSEIVDMEVVVSYSVSGPVMLIKTLEGVMEAKVNDWIIKGVNGEVYPCKPDIFEKTYERVGE